MSHPSACLVSYAPFYSVAGTIFNDRLAYELAGIPNLPLALRAALQESILVVDALPDGLRQEAIAASVKALRVIFWVPVASVLLGAISSL